jgi:hypothetical protein
MTEDSSQALPPHSAGRATFLQSVFRPNASELFCVLRNGEALPLQMSGTDLDVSCQPGVGTDEIVRWLEDAAHLVGWHRALLSHRWHMTAVSYIGEVDTGFYAVHFDIFDGIRFAGIPLLSVDELARESFVRSGVRQLTFRGRVAATVVHHLAWNGGLTKEKYRTELRDLLEDDEDKRFLQRTVAAALGPAIAALVSDPSGCDELGSNLTARRRRVRWHLLTRRLAQAPLSTMRALASYYLGQLGSMISPPGTVGRLGDRPPWGGSAPLSVEMACGVAPHGFLAPGVRSPAHLTVTMNGERYERTLRQMWRRWRIVRFVFPTAFLWYQAKRGRVVVLERLPTILALLQKLPRSPGWLAESATR